MYPWLTLNCDPVASACLPSSCWDHRVCCEAWLEECFLLSFAVLWMKPRTLHILSKHYSCELLCKCPVCCVSVEDYVQAGAGRGRQSRGQILHSVELTGVYTAWEPEPGFSMRIVHS